MAKAGIPIIVSHSAPTSLALSIAKAANITIIGFARGSRMNIYCNQNRIF
ncbi:formate dehydrogenase accessory sulfurtransferase FdhD [Clostridium sp. CF012]|nr:formate dehydrogenase accessory sulfurtransferase FdhD [Clostridium sp. CF012]MBU3145088.1 formate dehydrogenase accessory sulfurtransferase FdhD [Clostridium sp. CF012]